MLVLVKPEFGEVICETVDEGGRDIATANVIKSMNKVIEVGSFSIGVFAWVGVCLHSKLVFNFKFQC